MAALRLGLAQINPTVGNLTNNIAVISRAYTAAVGAGCHVVALPELAVTGYPPEDLVLKPGFISDNRRALDELVAMTGDAVLVVGFVDATEVDVEGSRERLLFNAAAVARNGRLVGIYRKQLLPNYSVFDEERYFIPGPEHQDTFTIEGVAVAVSICEDLWASGPVAQQAAQGAKVIVSINGSPFHRDKPQVRRDLVADRARTNGVVLAYVNQVGGQDELVFDGDSIVVGAQGELIARSIQFHDDILIVDLDLPASSNQDLGSDTLVIDIDATASNAIGLDNLPNHDRLDSLAEVYEALVVGLHDYVAKNGFKSVLIGLSGGIDSAFVAALACDALGADRVFGVSMPSSYSSEHSQSDAADLATRTGLHFRTVPIAPVVQVYLEQLGLTGLAEENLQARVRGTTLMGISNQEGHLVLATGNKSELAVGYSTIYGDAVGGFAPIKDLPKTDVWDLARWRNTQARELGEVEPIPLSSIEKPPSAELRPGQLDTDSLPDYSVLDQILSAYVEQDMTREQIVERGFDSELVAKTLRMVDAAEYKRRQYPPGTKVSRRAFGRDRRLPMTNKWQDI